MVVYVVLECYSDYDDNSAVICSLHESRENAERMARLYEQDAKTFHECNKVFCRFERYSWEIEEHTLLP